MLIWRGRRGSMGVGRVCLWGEVCRMVNDLSESKVLGTLI